MAIVGVFPGSVIFPPWLTSSYSPDSSFSSSSCYLSSSSLSVASSLCSLIWMIIFSVYSSNDAGVPWPAGTNPNYKITSDSF